MEEKDALGNTIEVGKWYAYTSRTSGFSTLVCGKAREVLKGKVVLENIIRGRAPLDNKMKLTNDTKRKVVTLNSNSVIPISEELVNLKEENA